MQSDVDLPDDVKKLLNEHPGQWVPFTDNASITVYFVSAMLPVPDDAHIRREVNKGLDSTDQHGSASLDREAFKAEARRRHESQSA